MLRGYRFLIVAACGLVVLVTLGTGAYFGSLYAPNHKRYAGLADKQSSKSDYRGPSRSLPDIAGIPGPVERAIANPQPDTGEDHEKRDLAAQESGALWQFWMVVASFASVAITAIGTTLLYKQIVLTREAVKDTGEATEAMREANRISKIALRPWLSVEIETLGPITGNGQGQFTIGYRLNVTNNGTNPALGVVACVCLERRIPNSRIIDFSDFLTRCNQTIGIVNTAVPPGESRKIAVKSTHLDIDGVDQTGRWPNGNFPTLLVGVTYFSPEQDQLHYTVHCVLPGGMSLARSTKTAIFPTGNLMKTHMI